MVLVSTPTVAEALWQWIGVQEHNWHITSLAVISNNDMDTFFTPTGVLIRGGPLYYIYVSVTHGVRGKASWREGLEDCSHACSRRQGDVTV